MVIFDFICSRLALQTNLKVSRRERRSHTSVVRWVTLSLALSQQSYFLQGRPASLFGTPGTRFAAPAAGVADSRWPLADMVEVALTFKQLFSLNLIHVFLFCLV